ncbi:MAG: hypothetical protein KDC33_03395 [Thermoleophilia bacterium]|nr:hypothetical protein [Thermoleophilia bacterium]
MTMNPISAAGSGSDILSLTMLRKAIDITAAQNAQLLQSLPAPSVAPGRVDAYA